jgi:hypothetical protein
VIAIAGLSGSIVAVLLCFFPKSFLQVFQPFFCFFGSLQDLFALLCLEELSPQFSKTTLCFVIDLCDSSVFHRRSFS